MRLQSLHYDGVPDQAVVDICRRFARFLKNAQAEGLFATSA
jgi:hypothetical protein